MSDPFSSEQLRRQRKLMELYIDQVRRDSMGAIEEVLRMAIEAGSPEVRVPAPGMDDHEVVFDLRDAGRVLATVARFSTAPTARGDG